VCLPTRTNGEIDGVMTFEVDVTERVRDARSVELAEVQLRELEERLRLALVAADIGTWDFNPINGALLRSLDSSRVLPEREQDRLPGKVEPGAIAQRDTIDE
jgi:PAS domain-containing protein